MAHDPPAGTLGQVLGAAAAHRLLGCLAGAAGLPRAAVERAVDALAVVVTLVDERLAVRTGSCRSGGRESAVQPRNPHRGLPLSTDAGIAGVFERLPAVGLGGKYE